MTSHNSIDPTELPAPIRAYLVAHVARDTETTIQMFRRDAVVVDEGRTFRGTDEIFDFLRNAGAEFTYTTELVGAERVDDEQWIVRNHLEGDFPGGVADLTYHFTMDGDRIAKLVIAG